jgi:hypothetical protein
MVKENRRARKCKHYSSNGGLAGMQSMLPLIRKARSSFLEKK